jgi:hypothetical protein
MDAERSVGLEAHDAHRAQHLVRQVPPLVSQSTIASAPASDAARTTSSA